jgi:hypothetical protein
MDIAKSLKLQKIVQASDCNYNSYKDLITVCPECGSAVFLQKQSYRKVTNKKIVVKASFKHFPLKAGTFDPKQCELRIRKYKPINYLEHGGIARLQNIKELHTSFWDSWLVNMSCLEPEYPDSISPDEMNRFVNLFLEQQVFIRLPKYFSSQIAHDRFVKKYILNLPSTIKRLSNKLVEVSGTPIKERLYVYLEHTEWKKNHEHLCLYDQVIEFLCRPDSLKLIEKSLVLGLLVRVTSFSPKSFNWFTKESERMSSQHMAKGLPYVIIIDCLVMAIMWTNWRGVFAMEVET